MNVNLIVFAAAAWATLIVALVTLNRILRLLQRFLTPPPSDPFAGEPPPARKPDREATVFEHDQVGELAAGLQDELLELTRFRR